MTNKMTLLEFKNYIKKEAEKLYKIATLKEEKEQIKKRLSILNESTPPLELGIALMDPETLKKVRQEMLQKASGWAVPEPKQQLDEKKYSDKASNFIGKEISHLQGDKGYKHDRAVAAAINVAKDKGYKVPAKNENTPDPATGSDMAQGTKITETAPSAGLSSSEKSNIVKKAKAGEDIGHKGKGFKDVAAKAAKEYGSKEAGERVAASSMWKNAAK